MEGEPTGDGLLLAGAMPGEEWPWTLEDLSGWTARCIGEGEPTGDGLLLAGAMPGEEWKWTPEARCGEAARA